MIASIAPRGVPTWLHEGLAQHFEGDDAAAARRRVAKIGVIPLRYLEGSFSRLTAAQASLAYDESLVIVDAAVSAPGHGLERDCSARSAKAIAPSTRSTVLVCATHRSKPRSLRRAERAASTRTPAETGNYETFPAPPAIHG